MALVLGGLLPTLSAQHDAAQSAETSRRLTDARDALYGYAVSRGRLPCPAIPAGTDGNEVVTTSSHDGTTYGNCRYSAGVLPWVTLGIPETDAWGRRFTYKVTGEFGRSVPQWHFNGSCSSDLTPPKYAAFALCSEGDMTITDGTTTTATKIPAVIISHGKNGYGGYTSYGTRLQNGTDTAEIQNQLNGSGTTTINNTFISKMQNDTYDDLVVYVSAPILFSKMSAVGKLP